MKWATQTAAMKYACYPTYHAIKVKHIVHDYYIENLKIIITYIYYYVFSFW